MIRNIRKKVADNFIRKSLQRERKVHAINLRKAQTIGFLFNASEKSNYLELKRLMNDVESHNPKTKMSALGWYKGKNAPEFIRDSARIKLFNKKDYNLLYRPKKKAVNVHNFLSSRYDILIDLTRNDIYPVRKVVAGVESPFKIGAFEIQNVDFYDLMIIHKNSKDYVTQIIHYLTLLNKDDKK